MDTLIGTVPDDWRTRRLEECCSVQPGPSGTTLDTSAQVVDGGIPVVTAREVDPEGLNANPQVSVKAEIAHRLHRYRLEAGDVVLVRVGSKPRHATVSERQAGWLLGNSCLRLRAETMLSGAYLACYLTHPSVQHWLTQRTVTGPISSLNRRTVGALPLVLPPLAVQHEIVGFAQAFGAKIRAHQDVIVATRNLRELLLPRILEGDPYPILEDD